MSSNLEQVYKVVDDVSGETVDVFNTREQARSTHQSLGGALNGYKIIQLTRVTVEKQVR